MLGLVGSLIHKSLLDRDGYGRTQDRRKPAKRGLVRFQTGTSAVVVGDGALVWLIRLVGLALEFRECLLRSLEWWPCFCDYINSPSHKHMEIRNYFIIKITYSHKTTFVGKFVSLSVWALSGTGAVLMLSHHLNSVDFMLESRSFLGQAVTYHLQFQFDAQKDKMSIHK